VIGVSSASDEALLSQLGASAFVPRGDDMAAGIRALVPDGVDGLIDAAAIGRSILGAVRDGGKIATVRAFEGDSERGISIEHVRVSDYARNQAALQRLADLVAAGQLTLRVAETFPPERAGEAQQKLQAGGVRGRLVIVF
jgi:NADPH:quinone reductase-like Zn-dependent oxidoreductase